MVHSLTRGRPMPDFDGTVTPANKQADGSARHQRQFHEIDRHNQALLRESLIVRQRFMKQLVDAANQGPEGYCKVAEQYRARFREKIIGRFDCPLEPPRARSRKKYDQTRWTGYEVVLDVFPGVFAHGILLLPRDLQAGERRPVVVCQHGLEGRPTDTIEGDHRAYHDFAAKLCERGYVVFAPQNPYIFGDRFRSLQRKANPLGKTLFSIITAQHQQILNWLKSQPFVDERRIAFYGLSYGGKTAMRVPAMLTDYCLSICSADFNEWVWKNAATSTFAKRYTYANKGEYEIFEWNLGQTFNYAEMAALIAPRPFMVERGHSDGVAPDETVAFEYAKVRRLYARLGIPHRTEIEFFDGPHTIHGKGTFAFLDKHLRREKAQEDTR
jgi:cephalosporin-C deacetylase-like acetyl esterase